MNIKDSKKFSKKEYIMILLILISVMVLSIYARMAYYKSNELNSVSFVYTEDNTFVDKNIKNVSSLKDIFNTNETFSSIFKTKYKLNNLNCNFETKECSFNKNSGDDLNSVLSSDFNLVDTLEENVLTVVQNIHLYNGENYVFSKNASKNTAYKEKIEPEEKYELYEYVNQSSFKNDSLKNIKTEYYFADESNIYKHIDELQCKNIKNCVFVMEYTQKSN